MSHFGSFFGIFDKLLSTQNVNVARFARNVECDFFCDFQTPCLCVHSLAFQVHSFINKVILQNALKVTLK